MKSALTVVVTITASILLSGCSLVQRAMPGSTMSNAEILGLLDTINRSEIDAGQLAKQKASTPEVRSFASRMMSEHQMMVQKVNQSAARLSVQLQKPALASTMEIVIRRRWSNSVPSLALPLIRHISRIRSKCTNRRSTL
jgi:predicted outer membrane protein